MTGIEYKAIREEMGLSQTQLGEMLGLTRKSIWQRENAEKVSGEAAIAIESLRDAFSFQKEWLKAAETNPENPLIQGHAQAVLGSEVEL